MTLTIPPTDALTGLHSATSFREALERSAEAVETLTLALVDVDNFQALNDIRGHKAGDVVLQALGQRLTRLAEDAGGFAGRLGGDEFAVGLPGVPLESAFLRLERFRSEVGDAAAPVPTPPDHRLTLSVGLANYPRDVASAADLLTRADQALWSAKQSGRNAVALPPSEEMVLKTCHYTRAQVGRLKILAEKRNAKESALLREALDDLLRKYDVK